VLLSTLYFRLAGIESWYYASFFWTIIPILGIILFSVAPINRLVEDGKGASLSQLFKNKVFWIFLVMMLCAGASELTMSQWASYFAESALGVEKWVGDLLGPCLFALAMAITRVFFAKASEKIKLDTAIFISSLICVATYVVAIISGNPILSLIGCACCGFGCGIMWPASFSLVSSKITNGGVLMFGVLALMGDGGCLVGPTVAGAVANAFGGNIRFGFAYAIIFPVLMAVMSFILMKQRKKNK
jgi:MFS family permease